MATLLTHKRVTGILGLLPSICANEAGICALQLTKCTHGYIECTSQNVPTFLRYNSQNVLTDSLCIALCWLDLHFLLPSSCGLSSTHIIRGCSTYWLWWHDDVIKWKHSPRYWWGESSGDQWIPLNKGHVTRNFDVFFDLRLNKRLSKNRDAGDLRRHHAHYDVTVMMSTFMDNQPYMYELYSDSGKWNE